VQVVKLLIMQSSLASRHFLSPTSKYPQHNVRSPILNQIHV